MGASLVSCFWSGGTYWWYLSFFTLGLGSFPFLLRLFSDGVLCWLCYCGKHRTHSLFSSWEMTGQTDITSIFRVCPLAVEKKVPGTKQVESTMQDNAVKPKVETRVLTFTSVGPGFERAVVGTSWAVAGRLAGGSLAEITFTKSAVTCAANGRACIRGANCHLLTTNKPKQQYYSRTAPPSDLHLAG